MKIVKKTLALLLTLVMAMAMCVTAFADEATTYTISTKSDDTHSYTVYQILTGDLSNGTLSNVKAGKNYKSDKGDAAAAAETLAALTGKDQELANAIVAYVDKTAGAYGTVSATSSLTGVEAGYYLIEDNGADDMKGDSYSTYIVKVVQNVEISPKKDAPTFEKKIKDTNDTTGVTTEWQDSADYDIGDDVPFQLTGTVPENIASYEKYFYQFSDQMEKGLTFNNDVKVYLNGTEISSDLYTVATASAVSGGAVTVDGATGFTVKFADLKQIEGIKANDKITVEYTATLNENAVLGSTGNVNEAKLIYSNNPNQSGEGENSPKGETPWDNVIVFTYKVVVNKYANSVAEGNELAGASFTLTKQLTDGSTKDIAVVTANDGKSFEFKGLDDGTYVLTETVTPAGYNTISPITFTVDANHNITWEGTTERTAILESLSGTAASGQITFTPNDDKSELATNVVNKTGATLPETGGIGTTIFYVIGGILVAGAAVLLVTRRRMSR